MSRTINLTIDVNSRKVTKFQDLVKLGDALSLSITALDGSKNYDFTNKSVHIFLKKADNTKVEQTLTISSNVLTCTTLDSQASTKVGQVEGELVILDASNNTQITSSTFTWQVEGSISDEVLTQSADSIETLIHIENIISNYNLNKDALAAENTKAINNIGSLTTQNQQATNNIAALQAMGDLTALQTDITAAKTEIANARGTYQTLKARLDASDASLSDRTKIPGVVDDTGSANTYVLTLATAPTAYASYQTFKFKAKTANTGASTLNVNGLGAKALVKNANKPLVTGDILAGQIITAVYDGTNFQIIPDLSIKIASMETVQSQIITSAMLLNGWVNYIDEDWARIHVNKIGKTVMITVYATTGSNLQVPAFVLPSFCNPIWLNDELNSGIIISDKNVLITKANMGHTIFTYIEV